MGKKKCEHILTQGERKGKKCKRYQAKLIGETYLCPRHMKRINSKPKADEFLKEYTGQQPAVEKKKKVKYSVFRITINSNKNYQNMTDKDKDKFKKLANYVFSDNIRKYLTNLSGKGNIIEIDYKYQFEVAPTNNKLHLHGVVEITHDDFYKINTPLLRDVLNKYFGSGLHINIQGSSNQNKEWDDYINKNVVTL